MKIFLLLSSLFLFTVAKATTWYISPMGNDATGSGTATNPWKTLYKATSTVATAGDIIHVNAGTYVEMLQCQLSVGVSIEGEGNTSILKSALTADWAEMLSLKSTEEGINGNQHISNLKFDGQNLATYWGIYIAGRSNVEVHHITMVDFKASGILFCGRIDNTEAPPSLYAVGNSFHNNSINNCAAYNLSTGKYGRGALNIGGQKGMLIYANTITQNSRPEGFNGWPIKYYNGGYLDDCKIFNNTLVKIPLGNPLGENGWDFAIELFNERGLEIYGNNMQGAIDLNFQVKGNYAYSAWIHDNNISQPTLNKFVETGITLEFGTEAAVIENNKFINLGVPFCFTPREGNIISNVVIRNNECNNIGCAGNHSGGVVKMGTDDNNRYAAENMLVYNNKFIGNPLEMPFWGIGILGASKVKNIKIHNNIFQNFSAGFIVANPTFVIDSITIENNNLTANGNGNKPAFSSGIPKHYTYKNNTSIAPSIFSFTNIKMNFIRPLYYAIKSVDIIELVAFFAVIFGILFCRKENVYVFPMVLIGGVASIFLSFDKEQFGNLFLSLYFIGMAIYGWRLWLKRNKRKHRMVRISSCTKKDGLWQLVFFMVAFIIIYLCRIYLKKLFDNDTIIWEYSFVNAAAFTAMWLTVKKKTESWYWWVVCFAILLWINFTNNYILYWLFYCLFIAIAILGLVRWKKKKIIKKV